MRIKSIVMNQTGYRSIFKFFIILLFIVINCSLLTASEDHFAAAASSIRDKKYSHALQLIKQLTPSPKVDFMRAYCEMKLENRGAAISGFVKTETTYPALADYAAYYQATILRKSDLPAALNIAKRFENRYADSSLLRPMKKLLLEMLSDSADYQAVIKFGNDIISSYPSDRDLAEIKLQVAKAYAKTGNTDKAFAISREIWITKPTTAEAESAADLVEAMAQNRLNRRFSADDIFTHATALYKAGKYSAAIKQFAAIPKESLTPAKNTDATITSAAAAFKSKNYKHADELLSRGATGSGVSQAQKDRISYWQARILDRQEKSAEALAIFQKISEQSAGSVAEDALSSIASIKRRQKRYSESAAIYDKLSRIYPHSSERAANEWGAAWSLYLAGNYSAAIERLKKASPDPAVADRYLYWLARSYLKAGKKKDGEEAFSKLVKEHPASFYSVWRREQSGAPDNREALTSERLYENLPSSKNSDKMTLLASLGLIEEAKRELRFIRKKAPENDRLATIAQLKDSTQLGDFGTALFLFNKVRPQTHTKENLPLWSAGFPRPYFDAVQKNCTKNALSEGLIYGLMRSESAFIPAIKSPVGAVGLMQLMPATAKMTAKEKNFNAARLVEPEYNIAIGTKHFKDLLKSYAGDTVYSIAAYNAGSNAVNRWRESSRELEKDEFIENIPFQETRDYVKKVYASAQTYRKLYNMR